MIGQSISTSTFPFRVNRWMEQNKPAQELPRAVRRLSRLDYSSLKPDRPVGLAIIYNCIQLKGGNYEIHWLIPWLSAIARGRVGYGQGLNFINRPSFECWQWSLSALDGLYYLFRRDE